jgi:hypothetical protein
MRFQANPDGTILGQVMYYNDQHPDKKVGPKLTHSSEQYLLNVW